jgi:hypothetical protein
MALKVQPSSKLIVSIDPKNFKSASIRHEITHELFQSFAFGKFLDILLRHFCKQFVLKLKYAIYGKEICISLLKIPFSSQTHNLTFKFCNFGHV